MILDGDKIVIGENNKQINKEFNEYLKLYPGYERKYFFELDKKSNIKLCRGLAKQLFIFLGFIFDRKIKLGGLESLLSIEEIDIISSILDEIVNLSRGIGNLLYEGNVLSSFVLLRSLLERTLIFLIIFEENNNIEINRRLKLYKNFGIIISYDKANELGEKNEKETILKEYGKENLEKLKKQFKVGNQYRFEKGVYNKKIGLGDLIERIIKPINNSFYQTLSLSTHGVYHNINLLGDSTFAPNLDHNLYVGIIYLEITLIREILNKLILYYFPIQLDIIEYFDSLLFNLAKNNEN